jgi:hypothetical protein
MFQLMSDFNMQENKKSSSYPFPTLSGVGTTYFSSCSDKDSEIIFTTGRLPVVNPP